MAISTPAEVGHVPPAETEDVELYHAKSWVTKYVFSQDAKVIAIQYSFTAIAIGLVARHHRHAFLDRLIGRGADDGRHHDVAHRRFER